MSEIKLNKTQSRDFNATHCLTVEDDDGNVYRLIDCDQLNIPFGAGEAFTRIQGILSFVESAVLQTPANDVLLLETSARDGLADILMTVRGLCELERRKETPFDHINGRTHYNGVERP